MIICLAAISLSGCSGRKAGSDSDSNMDASPIVTVCRTLDYSDTASLHKDSVMAMHMKDIVINMNGAKPEAIAEALDIFFNGLKDDPQSLRSATHYADLFLNNPDSPVRQESLYLLFLESLLNTPDIPEELAARSKEKIRKTSLNMKGAIANDFHYIDSHGRESSLHQLKASRTLLIFYDPECPHCAPILKKIASNPKVNAAISAGAVKVLAVYTEGKRDVWEKTKKKMPRQWTVAYDLTGILDSELYDIPAMPTVYLLDADKRVVVKDMRW